MQRKEPTTSKASIDTKIFIGIFNKLLDIYILLCYNNIVERPQNTPTRERKIQL